ncbi:four-helix bundle copper-binding protein [Hymenobacter persicinus]|uniref:Four-helix bundle copper-binding protein n=1 Tax=Hymenobacter persicinus TaxID=2025506 RepID=A0A4V1ZAY6_9BACT|nr:four-helix bundle copper-binding protein [Hymenobacter persicinus]RYU81234.1 four-helix bundle copper-binding protein [Hymenobacter persicinus]
MDHSAHSAPASSASSSTSQANQAVLDALSRCIAACEMCATACLQEADVKMMVPCIRLDRDCADICRLTAAFIARGSDHARHVLKECIEICRKCAEECGKHPMDHCQQCAEACRACMAACEKF